ncbi:ABC transporter permease [Roseibium sediminicola]|uniref:ABC transporter permease n=1 Tax=Roseibium sediminicola TaxID=2933272 RepID=A0ABT0GWX4_9HYPH|nr:ABC transporter permease [Roseibium sp. CAU 1639]MCK7613740.1 ABC transporter permease [Roseibium sp. CAU 1639]
MTTSLEDRPMPFAGTRPPARRPRWKRLDPEEVRGIRLLSPTFLYTLAFLVGPVLLVVAYSFWTQTYLTFDHTFTLENYRVALTEPIYRDLLMRSLYISFIVSLVTVIFAYPIAYYISFHGGSRKSLLLFLITIPFWTGYLLRVMAWKVILGYKGVLNTGLIGLGIVDKPLESLLFSSTAVIITLIHAWAVFAILPIYVSLEKLDRSLLEAATDLGDGPVRRFLRVTLPLSMPGIIGALLIVMIPTVGDFVTPKLVGGTEGQMIANAIQIQFGKASNWPLGSALTITTMMIVTLMAGASVLVLRSLVRWMR